ncbi:MAG: diacylglycerol/lipid kinase family protein [bacterium]
MKFENITVIANPISGNRRNRERVVDSVCRFFSASGASCRLHYTSRRGEATEFSRLAVQRRQDLVVVLGGDGTINEVATGLVQSDVTLAIIPTGSGNGFARTLGIPQDSEGALQLISEGHIAAIDVGKMNGRFFFVVAGVGFDAVVGKSFDDYHRRGPLSYFYLSAKAFSSYTPERIKVIFGGKSVEIQPFVLAIANGQQYGNNAMIAPQAKLNDGLLNVCIIHRLSLAQVFTQLPKLFLGTIQSFAEAEFDTADSILIQREQAGVVNIDGEAVMEGARLELSVLPRSLKVIAPRTSLCLA